MLEEKVNARLSDSGLLESAGGEVVTDGEPVLSTPALIVAAAPGAGVAVITAKVAGG